ncbi:cyclic nucleotide-binding domain-containing protein [Sediminitomix flava]|uniref:Cyclic nucleotide-binding domain-containing protein n=1 Tax=Sediminitomix flava TaxID=379075 RepID=A0A315ZW15_SEDFL|nr:cyclic nucleotide-binding domain-containing protein [Sediminitomix flava]PWJ40863.1 Cyclic nucleotide-binding domain-containing protein [Sediminitomix flava]
MQTFLQIPSIYLRYFQRFLYELKLLETPREYYAVKFLFAHHFFQGLTHALILTVCYHQFLSSASFTELPWAFLFSSISVMAIGRVFAYLERHLHIQSQIYVLSSFILLIPISLLLQQFWGNESLIGVFTIIAINLLLFLERIKSWVLSNKIFDFGGFHYLQQVNSLSSFPGRFLGFGFVFCFYLIFDTDNILLELSLFTSILSFIAIWRLMRLKFIRLEGRNYLFQVLKPTSQHSPEDFLQYSFNNSYILNLGFIALLTTIITVFLDYSFLKELHSYSIQSNEIKPQQIALLFLISYGMASFGKIYFTTSQSIRWGVKRLLLILPVFIVGIILIVTLSESLYEVDKIPYLFIAGIIIMSAVFYDNSIQQAVTFSLFQLLKHKARTYTYTTISGLVVPLGLAFSASLLLLIRNTKHSFSLGYVGILLLPVLLLFIVVVFTLYKQYINYLKEAVALRAIDFDNHSTKDKELFKHLHERLKSIHTDQVLYTADIIMRIDPSGRHEMITSLLYHENSKVREYAIEQIPRNSLSSYQMLIVWVLKNETDLELKSKVLKFCCKYNLMTESEMIDFLQSESHQFRRFALCGLLENERIELTELAIMSLKNMLVSEDVETQIDAIDIIGKYRIVQFSPILRELFYHENITVREVTILALGKMRDTEMKREIFDLLRSDFSSTVVIDALSFYGEEVLGIIEEEFVFSSKEAKTYLLDLCTLCARIDSRSAYQILWQLVDYPWHEMQKAAYNALGTTRFTPKTNSEQHLVFDQIDKLFNHLYWLYTAIILFESKTEYDKLSQGLQQESIWVEQHIDQLFTLVIKSYGFELADKALFIFFAEREYDDTDIGDLDDINDQTEFETQRYLLLKNQLSEQVSRSFIEKMLCINGFYQIEERRRILSNYYTHNIIDELSIINYILSPRKVGIFFHDWTKATALYATSPDLVSSMMDTLKYLLNSNDILLMEAAFTCLKDYGFHRGFPISNLLNELVSPTRKNILMGILSDNMLPLTELEKVTILKDTQIFGDIAEHELLDIAALVQEIRVKKDETIFHKGEKSDAMYIIYEGAISLSGDRQSYQSLYNYDFFGDLGFLDGTSRPYKAVAMKESLLLKVSQSDFYQLMMRKSDILKSIMLTLCDRIRSQSQLLHQFKK